MVVCIPNTSIQRSTFLLFYYSSTTDQAGRCFLPPTSPTLAYNHGHGRPMPGATPRFTQSQRRSPSRHSPFSSLFSLFQDQWSQFSMVDRPAFRHDIKNQNVPFTVVGNALKRILDTGNKYFANKLSKKTSSFIQ